jgi:hypothetical protein
MLKWVEKEKDLSSLWRGCIEAFHLHNYRAGRKKGGDGIIAK